MVTKKNIACLFVCSLVMLVSCELDYAPENTLVDEKVYKNEKTAEAALMGNYVRLNVFIAGAPQDQNNYANTGYTYQLGDLTTENFAIRENMTGYLAIEKGEFSSTEHDGVLKNIWHWGYNAIDFSNNIISGIKRYGQYNEAMERQHIAEAKFIRAYVYFYLLAAYGDQALLGNDSGDGVVLCLEPYNGYNPDNALGRSSNAAVWEQIIQDLEEAITDLPVSVPDVKSRIRANKAVAQALLSRVYLYKGTYTNNQTELGLARDLAEAVLKTTGYTFLTSSAEFSTALFPSNEYSQSGSYPDPTTRSNELIFYQPSRLYADDYPSGINYYRKNTLYVPSTMKDLYDENDVRRSYLIWRGSQNDNVKDSTTMKYSGGEYNDVIYMRMAEVKLTYAETLVRTQNSVSEEAVGHLNDVHQRAYPEGMKPELYTTADFPTVESFLKAVLKERNRELAYEGHYRWDLMRTNNLLEDKKLGAIEKTRWNLPVSDFEIRISDGKIKQNTGFN